MNISIQQIQENQLEECLELIHKSFATVYHQLKKQ